MPFPLASDLALSYKQIRENDSIGWLLFRIGLITSLWAGFFYFMYFVITDNETETGIPVGSLVMLLLFVMILPCCSCLLLLRKRRRREFLARLCGSCFWLPIYSVVFLGQALVSSTRHLASNCVVVREPRYRNQNAESQAPKHAFCTTCDGFVSKSRLLTGSSRVFHMTSPVEYHRHCSISDLRKSAATCHLCSFLLQSVDLKTEYTQKRSTRGAADVDLEASIPSPKKLKVKLWEEKKQGRSAPLLRIQLQGDCVYKSKPLVVDEIHEGENI